jgi:superfamily II DNA or RNA helicase
MSPTLRALPLRDYQRQALDAATEALLRLNRVAIVLPTGAGKTVCFAHDCAEWLAKNPGKRVLILVDLDELVWQTYREVQGVAPHLNVGIVKASRNETLADVIVASVQSLRNKARRDAITDVGKVIVDECEGALAATHTAILEHFGCFGGGTPAVGYTATLMRGDGRSLFPLWQEVPFQRDVSWMIRKEWLIPPRGLAVEVPDLDLRSVKTTRADYQNDALGEALAESLAPELVAKAVGEYAADRKVLAFFPTVASCYVFAEAFEAAGIPARVIHGGMGTAERAEILAWHHRGSVLVNCMLLTKGYNDPEIDAIVFGRPTKSKRLYIQMGGRGLRVDTTRPYAEQNCLFLDVVGSNAIHDLRSVVDLSDRTLSAENAHSGKTLVELEDELDAAGGVPLDETPVYRGPVDTREFDPMGRPSTKVWIKTKGGTFFVPAGKDHYVFIMQYPEHGQWSVCSVPKNTGRPTMTEHRGLPLDQALVWAEDLAYDLGAATLNTTQKSAPWRKKVASEKMIGLARGLGLAVEGKTQAGLFVATEKAGSLSDRITQVVGSRRIDPLVKAVNGKKA